MRPDDAAPDLGAFEVPEPAATLGATTALAAAALLARGARARAAVRRRSRSPDRAG